MSADATKSSSRTEWARVDAMADEEIDTSDIPPLDERFFATATLRRGAGSGVEMRVVVDPAMADWFRGLGAGWERRASAALRLYAAAHSTAASPDPSEPASETPDAEAKRRPAG